MRKSRPDVVFTVVNYTLLSIAFLIVIYPIVYIVSASFSSSHAVISGQVVLWPVDPTLDGYRAVFSNPQIGTGYANSFGYALVGTLINIVMTILGAYPLSRRDFVGRNVIMGVFAFTMFFSGGLIPTYLLVRSLGMVNTRWAMVVPGALSIWNLIIARTYFQHNIPADLLEASQLDGCSNARFITSVVVPLSGPIIAVLALWYAVGNWNSYFGALIYLKDARMYPLQLVLRNILILNTPTAAMMGVLDVKKLAEQEALRELLKYSLIVVASLPVLVLYPWAQKYFVKGIMIGAIKG